MSTRLKIGVSVGATIQVISGPGSMDFLKPSTYASIEFDDIPDDKEVRDRWEYLWKNQIGPQTEQLIDMMMEEASKRGVVRDSSVKLDKRVSADSMEEPVDGVYR